MFFKSAKKLFIFSVAFFLLFIFFIPKSTFGEPEVKLHYFYNELCPYCREAEKFLDGLQKEYPEIKINRYLAAAPENRAILEELAKKTGAEKHIGLVPLIFIGDRFFFGF